jgi:8-oxo-dGTP pyrophosphatase MutT (NUDIX family)
MSSTAWNLEALEAIAAATDLPQRVAQSLPIRTSDGLAARRFAPELSYGRHFGPAPAAARPAAVLALLYRRCGRWYIPLTARPAELVRHGGQISLPGGTVEPGESTEQAALRELGEELGVSDSVEIVGRLNSSYVFASDYAVTPWVAWTNESPTWRPQTSEVSQVIELPVATLLAEGSISETMIQRGPVVFRAPSIQYGEHVIWGATSVILGQLAAVLRRVATE